MAAIAGMLPEFMVGIWNAYRAGNINLAYNLQFAIRNIRKNSRKHLKKNYR